jgi:hypothetical protein
MASAANVSLGDVAILSIRDGSLVVEMGIVYTASTDPILVTAFVQRIQAAATNVSYLFASQPALIQAFGTPYVTAVNTATKVGREIKPGSVRLNVDCSRRCSMPLDSCLVHICAAMPLQHCLC